MEATTESKDNSRAGNNLAISPLVTISFLYACGCFLAPNFPIPGSAAFLAALFTLMIAGIGYFYSYRSNHRVLYLLFFLLGILSARMALIEAASPLAEFSGQGVALTGSVATEPDIRSGEARYVIRVAEAHVGEKAFKGGKVLVVARDPGKVFGYGDSLKVRGVLRSVPPPGNPGDFDYAAYLARHGIGIMVYTRGDGAVLTGSTWSNPLAVLSLKIKNKIFGVLDKLFSAEHSALLKGIAFGTRTAIDPAVNEAFVETGVVHILSVSGLHVGLVLGFIFGLTHILKMRSGTTILTVVTALLVYDLMVGLSPPVIRASVMAVLLLWARHVGRERDWPTAVAVAALIILLANPLAITDAGFQLSFAATWGILFLGPEMVKQIERVPLGCKPGLKKALAWGVAVPLSAQLSTLPLVAIHYNLISPVALLANIAAVPLTGIILLLGILAAVSGLVFMPLGQVLAVPAGLSLDLFLYLVRLFRHLPGAVIYVPSFPWAIVGLWFGLLYLVVMKLSGRSMKLGAAVSVRSCGSWAARSAVFVLVVLAWMGLIRWMGGPDTSLRVEFIDVGQGDSTLIRTPGGRVILIDTGGTAGELTGKTAEGTGMRVVRYLRREGVRRIDVLVLTHPHEDHCGGTRAVVERLPVKLVVVPPLERGVDEAYDGLLELVRKKGIAVSTASAGDSLTVDPAIEVSVLAPFKPLSRDPEDFNDESLVLQLSGKGKSILLAGDLQEEGQRRLLQYGSALKSDVLKVPHHGSALFLPAFYKMVQPEYAVISVGPGNRYGMPSTKAVSELERLPSKVYRTDRDGAVQMRFDGRETRIKTGRKELRPAA
ncbi:MAG: DNA internalization-related competence protein ComEC/Rec2 [Bacillota bacterium]